MRWHMVVVRPRLQDEAAQPSRAALARSRNDDIEAAVDVDEEKDDTYGI